jgi:uncharacterized protein (TIGR03437 family)
VTITGEEVLNLNPSLSGDGRFIAFESTADLAEAGGNGFHALRADLLSEPLTLTQLGNSRSVTPAISQDGSFIAFASYDNPLGTNADGNSEIFLYHSSTLIQITNTAVDDPARRITDGCFQPSISDDGRFIAFSANRDLIGRNSDHNLEIYLFDTTTNSFQQLTNSSTEIAATAAKISGNGSMVAFLSDSPTSHELILQSRLDPQSSRVVANNTQALTLAQGRAISDDGLRVVYSAATAANSSQIFLWDGRLEITRQLTQLGARNDDALLQASLSGDGLRVAFATRRDVLGENSDHSVELYMLDIPSGQIQAITDAPASATADVVSSLNDDGSLVTFSFPRVLAGAVSSNSFANNSEIFVTTTNPRPLFGSLLITNGAAHGKEATSPAVVAPASIAIAKGEALARVTEQAQPLVDKTFPLSVAGTTVAVNGHSSQILFVSPSQVNFVVPAAIANEPAEVIVTNADGYRSRTTVSVAQSAPGLFSTNGMGFGEGVILNADTLQAAPFDPASGVLRLSVFATGVGNASNVSVKAAGHSLTVESINTSPDLPGLDEIHVRVPAAFRGVGTVNLLVQADGRESNPVDIRFTAMATPSVLINEVLADPPDGLIGDANHDGTRSSSEDEFLELVNAGDAANISGWTIRTRSLGGTSETVRHRFAAGTVLLPGEAVVVFGGGTFDPADPMFGCANVIETSSAGLSLTNGGLTLIVRDADGGLVTELTYGGTTGLAGDNNQSLTRSPDISGGFVEHATVAAANGRRFSPGLRTDGTPLNECPARLSAILLSTLSATLSRDETISLQAKPVDFYGRSLPSAAVNFTSDNATVVSVDNVSVIEPGGIFLATISAHAPGVAHLLVEATLGDMTVTASVAISVIQPEPPPLIVINQIYGGGNNSGATFQNDFVELFNRGVTAVDFAVTPYSLQYASASGSFSNANKLNLTSGTLAPGQYFLIRLAGGTTNGAALPPADVSTTTINLSASDGKVALIAGMELLGGSGCPLNPTVADFVGYGTANCSEGVAVAALNATKAGRRVNRCVDSNMNATDFAVIANPPAPQNSTSPIQPCQ